jgi:hypothetical protein
MCSNTTFHATFAIKTCYLGLGLHFPLVFPTRRSLDFINAALISAQICLWKTVNKSGGCSILGREGKGRKGREGREGKEGKLQIEFEDYYFL